MFIPAAYRDMYLSMVIPAAYRDIQLSVFIPATYRDMRLSEVIPESLRGLPGGTAGGFSVFDECFSFLHSGALAPPPGDPRGGFRPGRAFFNCCFFN